MNNCPQPVLEIGPQLANVIGTLLTIVASAVAGYLANHARAQLANGKTSS